MRKHIDKNIAAIKYHMHKADKEIYESLNELTWRLLCYSMADDLESLSMELSSISNTMFDRCSIAKDSGVSYKYSYKEIIKEYIESEQDSN